MLDIPLGPPVGATGGGGGGVLPLTGAPAAPGAPGAPGPGEAGWLLGIGVVGSLPAGWLKDGCSGGFGSDMASLSEGDVNGSLACSMLGRGPVRGPGSAPLSGASSQVSGVLAPVVRRVATRLRRGGS